MISRGGVDPPTSLPMLDRPVVICEKRGVRSSWSGLVDWRAWRAWSSDEMSIVDPESVFYEGWVGVRLLASCMYWAAVILTTSVLPV